MTEFPIIFSSPMVRALLDGRKVLTRRLAWSKSGKPSPWQKIKSGDRLWVRETHYVWSAGYKDGSGRRISYRASDPDAPCQWTPSIFTPRWAARLELGVTMTRVEPLAEISDLDAIAEGIQKDEIWGYRAPPVAKKDDFQRAGYDTPRVAFLALWEALHGTGSWALNPEVVVIGFTVLKRA